ncbi:ABC transporter ATP-binding protein [Sinomicrobium sp. M5D2P9]
MITTQELTKKYGEFTALNRLNLHVGPGDIYCLLGANGAGKSTTINLLLDYIKPTSGEALINGKNVRQHSLETKKHIAYIPENLMLYPNLTAVENLDYFSGVGGTSLQQKQLEELLLKAGLQADAHHKRTVAFSKGMRQKVGIAIALAKQAKALLLDEPTSGLDPKASNEFGRLLQQLRKDNVAILMTTHDLFRAKEIATRIGIMKAGKLMQEFNANDISLSELEHAYLKTMDYKELAV